VYAHAGSDTAICYSASVTIGGSPAATGGLTPYTYSWSPRRGLSDSTEANPVASPTATTTYILTVTDLDGSVGKDTVAVTANSLPSVPEITASGKEGYFSMSKVRVKSKSSITIKTATNNFCAGDPVVFTVTLPNGYSAPALYNETQRQTITKAFTNLSGGAYAVTVTSADAGYPYRNSTFSVTATNGACNIKALINIYISPSLDVQVPKDKICVAETLEVTASAAETQYKDADDISHYFPGGYEWSPANALDNSTGTNIMSGNSYTGNYIVPISTVTATTTYTVTGSFSSGNTTVTCHGVSRYSFTVTVTGDKPSVTVNSSTSSTVPIAIGCSTTLSVDAPGSSYFTWYPGTGLSAVIGSSVVASPTTTTTYYVSGFNSSVNPYGCCSTAMVVVNVENPTISCTANCSVCESAGSKPELSTGPSSYAGATYRWFRNGTEITGATNSSYHEQNFQHAVTEYRVIIDLCGKTHTLYYTVPINHGCRMEQNSSLSENSLLCYPNPTDGIVTAVVNNNQKEQATIAIYNLMGQKVFEKEITLDVGENKIELKSDANVPDGTYRLRILTAGRQLTGSFVKTH